MKKEFDNAVLLIVGEGPYKNRLMKIAQGSGCRDIYFLGARTQEEIVNILNATDIFVNPSYSEGLPTTVIEACAVGVPVIATDVGGTREIIREGVNGFLISPQDQKMLYSRIYDVLRKKDEWKNKKNRIRESVKEKYAVCKVTDMYTEILGRLIECRSCA